MARPQSVAGAAGLGGSSAPIGVLVVDDSAIIRGLISRTVNEGASAPRAAAAQVGQLDGGAPIVLRKPGTRMPSIIAIGASTGGPRALLTLLGGLTFAKRLPIVIAQHMPATFTTVLAEHITRDTGWPCAEAENGEAITNGRIYLAPGDYHMTLAREGARTVTRLDQTPPVNFCRPAVDPLFRSVAECYGAASLAILLTGMGHDGLIGGGAIVEAGGSLVAQDRKTSVVWGMPGAVATAGHCCAVLPLGEIASYVEQISGVKP